MDSILTMIDEYLKAKKLVWSPSTFKSEASRLRSIAGLIDTIHPEETFRALKDHGYKLYTIKTTMTRINKLFDWLIIKRYMSCNPYKDWLEEHNYLFRNAYKKKELNMSFETAFTKINAIKHGPTRQTAIFLLYSGIRVNELNNLDLDEGGRCYVIGKGGKRRRVFAIPPETIVKKSLLRKELSKINLTPHDLRRLFATRLLRKQVPIHDVAKATGHSSIQTLMRYLQSDSDDKLQESIEEVIHV